MASENKAVELNDEELEKVIGGDNEIGLITLEQGFYRNADRYYFVSREGKGFEESIIFTEEFILGSDGRIYSQPQPFKTTYGFLASLTKVEPGNMPDIG